MRTKNIFLAGVGGQGVLLASELLCMSLLECGYDVKKSEVHGMAQRGGSVTSHVRYGEKVFSPLIPEGEADILMGFEALEALRWIGFLKKSGILFVNRQVINPSTVTSGQVPYPDRIYERIQERHPNTRVIEGLDLAKKAGNVRAVNSVLLGVVAGVMQIPDEVWERVIAHRIPERLVPVNLRAFELGRAQ